MGTVPLVRDVVVDQIFHLITFRQSAFSSLVTKLGRPTREGRQYNYRYRKAGGRYDGKGALDESYLFFLFGSN